MKKSSSSPEPDVKLPLLHFLKQHCVEKLDFENANDGTN